MFNFVCEGRHSVSLLIAVAFQSASSSCISSVSSLEQRIFAYSCFVGNSKLIITYQHEFRRRFKIRRNDSVHGVVFIQKAYRKAKPPANPGKIPAPESVEKR
ncbi:hypothetical protein AVEN_128439-1 [Araneus ventricosus]|uniref:DUF4817 domain-containing protein n=1 Tax=Araneus ventricosus TaxID=182803 RepID=A0A4Y2WJA8_ARAVE|nr:hypothetical protein AVEN_20633-1 [Araneus ventricosus]GBO36683.1 hypothetical protein AVEN_128439-1 [Araneus ventricosus]